MHRKQHNVFIAVILIALSILLLLGEGYAVTPKIRITVNPAQPDVYAGAGRIILTAQTKGSNIIAYTWKLTGSGKLEGDMTRSAIAYIPPDKIGDKSDTAVITVTVTDDTGQQTTVSVSFTILPKPEPPEPPTSTPTPIATFKPQGMAKETKVALGIGAAAALGGGIALLVDAGDDNSEEDGSGCSNDFVTSCAGVKVGGYCWYLSAVGAHCEMTCANHGGYHEATRTYAGSDGTNANCTAVMSALGVPVSCDCNVTSWGAGCYTRDDFAFVCRDTLPTTALASVFERHRACACCR